MHQTDPVAPTMSDPASRIRHLVASTIGPDATRSPSEAVVGLDARDLSHFLHARFDPGDLEVITTGLPASPGAASGRVVLNADAAVEQATAGQNVILVREETSPDDVLGMQNARGILTMRGGLVSHAAVVARGWGIPAVVGAEEIRVLDGELHVGSRVLRAGDEITIDGRTGHVYAGAAEVTTDTAPAELSILLDWADQFRAGRVAVRANADNAEDARHALRFGAEGIGLCRTEHMFLAEDRLPLVRRMILGDAPEETTAALAALEEVQTADFTELLKEMGDRPVTVRLLDPPLHEFLPNFELLVAAEAVGTLDDTGRAELAGVRRLHEANPMIGTRGVRLGVVKPDLYPMQVRAISRALAAREAAGDHPHVEVMIPLVVTREEMVLARSWVEEAMASVAVDGRPRGLSVGTMVETPRAALVAGELAANSDFFSFGTNDLTQLTYAFSRDDVESKLLPTYLADGLLDANPFEVLDQVGVGRLVRLACEEGRAARPDLKLGVCGEQVGDPASARFFVSCGLDYVSCSPYRVPIARLAVAQALLESGAVDPDLVATPDTMPDIASILSRRGGGLAPHGATPEATPAASETHGASVDTPDDDPALDDVEAAFRVRHALRIKGFAELTTLAEIAGVSAAATEARLQALADSGHARFLEARSLWQLTPEGKEAHAPTLPGATADQVAALRKAYEPFLALNDRFKQLCTAWQVRDGQPNDHEDTSYDADRLDELAKLDSDANPILEAFGAAVDRIGRYRPRLTEATERVLAGEQRQFTGVMCNSYHDIWMELHEDLILLLGIDRTSEGSF